MTYEAERFKAIYSTIRQKFPELLECDVSVGTTGVSYYGGRVGGRATFVLAATAISDAIMWHETGHALADVWGDARLPQFWQARGFPGTWEQQHERHLALLHSPDPVLRARAWANSVNEMWAENFAATYLDYRDTTENFGVPIDRARMRAFYEQGAPASAPATDIANAIARGTAPNLGQPTTEAKVVMPAPTNTNSTTSTPERAPEWRGPLPGSNFMPGREGTLIDRIVLHHMDGTLAGTHAHFTNPTTKVSAHFGVGRDITVQWVSTGDTAYHAGNFDVNMRSIGIEVEDMGRDEYTEAQYLALIQLVKDLATTHGIPLDREHVIGHRQVVTTTCPGTLDVDRVVRDAGGDDMDDQRVREIIQEEVRATIESIKAELGKQAHHTHKTGEPEAA